MEDSGCFVEAVGPLMERRAERLLLFSSDALLCEIGIGFCTHPACFGQKTRKKNDLPLRRAWRVSSRAMYDAGYEITCRVWGRFSLG